MRFKLPTFIILVLFFTGVFCVIYGLNAMSCRMQWQDSNFQVKYTFMAGCQVKTQDGAWIPSTAVRVNK